jgi:serine/threonine protein kinase
MAPEVVKQTAYTSKADIWSLGCLVVEMLTGAPPWANLTQMQAIFRVRLFFFSLLFLPDADADSLCRSAPRSSPRSPTTFQTTQTISSNKRSCSTTTPGPQRASYFSTRSYETQTVSPRRNRRRPARRSRKATVRSRRSRERGSRLGLCIMSLYSWSWRGSLVGRMIRL